jgi:transcriptional regulator with XRE-family HTH domain
VPTPLAERLRDAIKERDLSQRELARLLAGPDAEPRRVENERRQIAKYLAGQHAPSIERARVLAELLDKPADYFIDPAEARTRLADQLVGLVGLVEELREIVKERFPEEDEGVGDLDARSVGRRLAALEAQVEGQGKAMTKALRGVTRQLLKVEEALERQGPQQAARAPRASGGAQ